MVLQRIRFFIWCLAGAMVAAGFLVATVNTAHDRDRLAAEVIRKDRDSAAERREASRERQTLIDGQRRLEVKYDALLTTNRNIVSYLNGRGIFIPEAVFDGESDSSDDDDDNDNDSSKSSTGGSGKESPPKSGPAANDHGSSSGGSGKGQGSSGGHDKGHGRSDSKGHSEGHHKAKGHEKK